MAKNVIMPKLGNAPYDIAVIGGGPGGYVAAIKAAQLGAKVVLFEKDTLGGVCLNRGCIPTKTLLKTAKEQKKIKRAADYAIEGVEPGKITVNMVKLQQRKKGVVTQLTSGVGGLLKANGVVVVKGEALMSEPGVIQVGESAYRANQVIISTGSVPRLIPIPGIDSPSVITSDEALMTEKIPSRILILGGGVIGVEFALIFHELGAKVAVVEMLDRLLPTVDEEIAAEITKIMQSSGIEIYTGSKAKAITGNSLIFEKDGNDYELQGEKILVAVGRAPSYEGIDVNKLGVRTEKGAIVTDDALRTNVPGIYALGDVNGKLMLAHKASAEGIVAVENIMGKAAKMDYRVIPQCVYSFPEIASVGLTEKEAREKYGEIKVGKFPFAANGKALIEDETKGFVKVIADKQYKEILGVHIIGPAATDLISEAVVAMKLECTADELAECIHPHPTIAEALMEAFHDTAHKAVHFFK